mgnify:CR=1 FL=1
MSPFSGVRVLDLTHVLAGPFAAYQLATLGADVIKIEPPNGESLRHMAPPGKSGGFPVVMLNANKRGVTLNLKHEQGRAVLKQMVAKADVLL